ncbi:MAG: DUF5752 family protein [Chloroflexota bacterium]
MSVLAWFIANWSAVLIPLAVFTVALIAMFWLRRRGRVWLFRWVRRTKWQADSILVAALDGPSLMWCLILSALLALMVSSVLAEWKDAAVKVLWTLFLASIALSVVNVLSGLVGFYGPRIKLPTRSVLLLQNVARILIIAIAFLIALDIWGVPTTPLLFLIGVGILAALFGFRDAVPNLVAGFQLGASQLIRAGDYIKLETGEEGYVTDVNWRTTRILALDQSTIIVPNSRLVQGRVVNYGRPLKKAAAPFRFNSRTHLTELTGMKASNLKELADLLRQVPDSVIYYHTHHFFEEHHQLTPELSNDFAIWASDALGEDVLGESLASIDTFAFPNMAALRDRLIGIIEDYSSKQLYPRQAMEGRAFYFMKSVSVVLPSRYVVHDLREFVEALRKITPGSLYFHMFESRLRLGQGRNDFSIWLDENLGDKELADEVAHLDPYTYTLEGLRSALIQLIEKRIK